MSVNSSMICCFKGFDLGLMCITKVSNSTPIALCRIVDRETVAVDLAPELRPPLRGVRQAPHAQDRRRSRLLPFHPRAAQPLLDDHLARRLGHPRADR